MNEQIKNLFGDLTSRRNWYAGTSINRAQAFELKRRFKNGELSLGRVLEVLLECGHEIDIKKK